MTTTTSNRLAVAVASFIAAGFHSRCEAILLVVLEGLDCLPLLPEDGQSLRRAIEDKFFSPVV